eukprot:5240398-Pyramimonas_sp.AAC.3
MTKLHGGWRGRTTPPGIVCGAWSERLIFGSLYDISRIAIIDYRIDTIPGFHRRFYRLLRRDT